MPTTTKLQDCHDIRTYIHTYIYIYIYIYILESKVIIQERMGMMY